MRIFRRWLLLSLLAANAFWLISAQGGSSAAEPLVWKFVVGDVHQYQMLQDMNMSMNLGPAGETVTTVKQTMDMTWEVEAIGENGAATIAQQITRMQMEISATGQDKIVFDTASEERPSGYAAMLAPMLTALTSSTFKLAMLPNGEISDVEVPEDLIEAMSRGPGAAMMGGLATAEGFKKMVSQGSLTLPKAEDLVEGHEWQSSWDVANPITGKITTTTTYRYAGPREIEDQQFEVFVPKIETLFEEGPDGASVKVTKQESTGEILFNRTAGRLESSTIDQLMESVITVEGNTIQQKLDQKVRFKILPEVGGEE